MKLQVQQKSREEKLVQILKDQLEHYIECDEEICFSNMKSEAARLSKAGKKKSD